MNAKDQRIHTLELENAQLKAENAQLRSENEQLKVRVSELEATIKVLVAKIEELERRLAKNSSNSSKPPSSDGFRKPLKSMREKSGKKPGGQLGHKGESLKQVEGPDVVVEHHVDRCAGCGAELDGVECTIECRQEFDIEIKVKVTEHRAYVKKCKCGKRNSAMPEHMKAATQYGPNVKTAATYFSVAQLLPRERTAELFRDLFKTNISEASLIEIDRECAERLAEAEFDKAALESIANALVKHADETGFRIKAKTWWLHTLSTEIATYYRISPKRGVLLNDIVGTLVHDHWKSYFTIEDILHALCNAHHLREIRAIIEHDKEAWAQEMSDLLVHASRLEKPTSEQQKDISDKYDKIVIAGFKYHEGLKAYQPGTRKKRPSLNLLIRLKSFKVETLRFLYDENVPFTNNLAERDLRMMKLKQKISGCFRSEDGAEDFTLIRSFISTTKKQEKDVFSSINDVFSGTFKITSLFPEYTSSTAPPPN